MTRVLLFTISVCMLPLVAEAQNAAAPRKDIKLPATVARGLPFSDAVPHRRHPLYLRTWRRGHGHHESAGRREG